jgi:hypothetical protein
MLQRVYRKSALKGLTGYSPGRIMELVAEGKFPKPKKPPGGKILIWGEVVLELWQRAHGLGAWDNFDELVRMIVLNALSLCDTAHERKILIEKLQGEIAFLKTSPLRAEGKAVAA